ncbi:MAG: hypothetical protein KDA89_00785, partial [Planctomycetaceae bacterium]|nr:hypothetical protein [Planctomycetaceae bacterium]
MNHSNGRFVLLIFGACAAVVWSGRVFTVAQEPTASAQETAGTNNTYQVGVSTVDITPDYPIRLNGFGNRREESEGVS